MWNQSWSCIGHIESTVRLVGRKGGEHFDNNMSLIEAFWWILNFFCCAVETNMERAEQALYNCFFL